MGINIACNSMIKKSIPSLNLEEYSLFKTYDHNSIFYGWGRKKSGKKAIELSKKYDGHYHLLEDGFIRSLDISNGDIPFSYVVDKKGIYYDATKPSTLEDILNEMKKEKRTKIELASTIIEKIKTYKISKYNHGIIECNIPTKNNVLIIAQTLNDLSLEYGYGTEISSDVMIKAAILENPNSTIYLKIHPDVLAGKKESNINLKEIPSTVHIITENYNPISLLEHFHTVYTHTSQMGFEALILGKKVIVYGLPFYAGWGLTIDRIFNEEVKERRKEKLTIEELVYGVFMIYSHYQLPNKSFKPSVFDVIEYIHQEKTLKKCFLFGFSKWKHTFIPYFLQNYHFKNHLFITSFFKGNELKKALKMGLNKNSVIAIWGKKEFSNVEEYAINNNIPLLRIEDGFIRSMGLGSDLTMPHSLVVDDSGIYFDSSTPSKLETILNTYEFKEEELNKAKYIKKYLINNQISKYNMKATPFNAIHTHKKIILVPGQVEDDASIKYSGNPMTNLELLQKVKHNNPDAYIIYKPHPDVLVGNRKGAIKNSIASHYCNTIETKTSISTLLDYVDEIHTISSLVGMEGLVREKKVITYGMPFYAGWGLTNDMLTCKRRQKALKLEELIYGTYVLYPLYIDVNTNDLTTIDTVLNNINFEKNNHQSIKLNTFFSRTYLNLKRIFFG